MIKILSSKPVKTFTCRHCLTRFITDEWRETKRGFSMDCPCCKYATWTPR